METREFRKEVLARFGATGTAADELLAYNENVFDHSALDAGLSLPLEDEPFLNHWEAWAEEAARTGVFAALRKRLIQLNFPVREGIGESAEYREALDGGAPSAELLRGEGLALRDPRGLELRIHPTPAGRIPVITAGDREDFADLLRALTRRNEPAAVPASQGAAMVAGYVNRVRLGELREGFIREGGFLLDGPSREEGLRKLLLEKHRYQDRFILLSGSSYSGVAPGALGLNEEEWREKSMVIRREHECSHYFTKRVLSSMRNRLLDELIADYAGIAAAAGRFIAGWFLAFMGLEGYPAFREGGRLGNYRGDPPLGDGAFAVLCGLVRQAALNIEACEDLNDNPSPHGWPPVHLALTRCTLEELASDECRAILAGRISPRGR